jgi:hypothetical protein
MFALVLAMVTLQNSAPDASATPSSAIASKLPGASQATGLQSSTDPSSGFGNITVTVGCTYGAPRLGPSLLGDATDLSRTFGAPACTDTAPLGFGSNPAAFEGGAFRLGGPLGYVPFYQFSSPNVGRPSFAPLAIEPASHASDTASTFTLPSRSAGPRILDHLSLPAEFRGSAGPLTISGGPSTVRGANTPLQPRRPVPKTH